MFNWLKKVLPVADKAVHAPVGSRPCNDALIHHNLLNEGASYKKRGNELLAQGRREEAAECYRQALAINPDYAEACLNLAFVLKELKLFEEAGRYLKRAISVNPEMEDAYYLLGVVSQEQGNLNVAIESFQKALELKPDFEIVYGDLFYALFENGQNERAEAVIQKGIALNPDIAEFHYYLGNLYVSERKPDQAISCFLKALSLRPDYVEAHCSLGHALQAQGELEEAVKHYHHALTLKPDDAEVHNNLGNALQAQGRFDEAIAHYHHALTLKPEIAEARFNLINLRQAQGKLDQAVEYFRHALTLMPDDAAVHCNLGHALHIQGKLDDAAGHYRHALLIKPDYAEAHNSLGFALDGQGKLDEAIERYHQALTFKPDFSAAHRNLIAAYQAQGRLDEVVESYRQELSLNPDNAVLREHLGHALRAQGKLNEAVECYRHALALKPNIAVSHSNLGYALQAQGKLHEAIKCYHLAISLNPDIAETHNNLGSALEDLSKIEEAIQSYRRAISLRPGYVEAYNNLGHALQVQGKLDEAIANYRHALSMNPGYLQVHSNLLFVLSFHESCSPSQYLAEARGYGSRVTAQAKPYSSWSVNPAGSGMQPLRVGMVSGDFRNHPVVFFLEGVLAHLDPARVELVAYPTQLQEDECSARVKPHFSAWEPIAGLSDEYTARKIHEDGIHILIDLSGHTAHNRLPVFAWKPAPVQVSWLGYLASTGVPGMDYLLADTTSVPESHQKHFTETIWYMPDSLFCLTPPAANKKLAPTPLPAISKGYITFGSFQRMDKVTDSVLALWGRIFRTLPQSRLRLQNTQMNCPATRKNLLQRLAGVGIIQERVIIEGGIARDIYLEAYTEVDIVLDTFPYPGVTTTCEALWMGVPTVTLAGQTLLSRQGASLLTCAGLEKWVAGDEDNYVALALAHAADLDRLAQLRSGLRQQVLASPLFDVSRFARHLEDALQGMWQQKMSGVAENS